MSSSDDCACEDQYVTMNSSVDRAEGSTELRQKVYTGLWSYCTRNAKTPPSRNTQALLSLYHLVLFSGEIPAFLKGPLLIHIIKRAGPSLSNALLSTRV